MSGSRACLSILSLVRFPEPSWTSRPHPPVLQFLQLHWTLTRLFTLGPVVTNGKDTVWPDRMSFPTEFEHVSLDGSTVYDKSFPGHEDDRGHYKIPGGMK